MISEVSSENKRIAKNSVLLYIRLAVVMVGGLYISRIILDALGASDYGLYNVVGGFVTMFTIVSSSLTAATSRFITFELGKNDMERLKTVFSISVSIHIVLSIILFVILESFGVWYLNEKMVVEPGRLIAANYVLQFSIVSLLFNMLNIPYNAALMAHEHMDFYAYVSIFEVLARLVISLALPFLPSDALIAYAFFIMLLAVVVRILYIWYCKRNFEECSYTIKKDKEMLRGIFVFSGWNFIGATSGILKRHGNNIVLNLFGGTVVNAAYGLAMQVTSAVINFSSGVQNAINPQIIKQYSIKNMEYMYKLIFYGSRTSFYFMMFVFIPVFLNTDTILGLWLKEVPKNTTIFLQISLIICLIDTWSGPLVTAMLATANIKTYQLVVGGTDILCLPLSYICLREGLAPYWVFIVMLIISFVTLLLRLVMLKGMINLPSTSFLLRIVGKTSIVCLISLLLSYWMCSMIVMSNVFWKIILYSIISIVISLLVIGLFDTNKKERALVMSFVRKRVRNDSY